MSLPPFFPDPGRSEKLIGHFCSGEFISMSAMGIFPAVCAVNAGLTRAN